MAAETSFFRDRCLAAIDFWAAIGNPCSTKRGQCSTSRRLFSTKGRWKSAKGEILWGNEGTMVESCLETLAKYSVPFLVELWLFVVVFVVV